MECATMGHLNLASMGEGIYELLSTHPAYQDAFFRCQDCLLYGDGPLPEYTRHYIALMAASRHRCSYLVEEQKSLFRESGGPENWLEGLQFAPHKFLALDNTNKILAHRPWYYNESHVEHLLKNNWSMSELTQAICILAQFHALCSLVHGMGMESLSEDTSLHNSTMINPSSNTGSPSSLELSEGGIEVLLERMKIISDSEVGNNLAEEQKQFNFERLKSQTVSISGELPVNERTSNHRYAHLSTDSDYTYVDFGRGKQKSLFPTMKFQDCSWEEHGFSILNSLHSEIGDLFDEKFKTAYRMTYYTFGNKSYVDTYPFRRGVWNYLHCLYGIRHDDYDYSRVHKLIERNLKRFLKTVTCYPERLSSNEHSPPLMKGFLESEKTHVLILVVEARLQAELLYALRALGSHLLQR